MPRNKVNEFDKMMREQIAANIKRYCDMRGYSQDKLSDLTGIKQSTLSGYFRATSTPAPDKIQIIAQALGVTKADIDPVRFGDGINKKEPTVQDSRLQGMMEDFNSLSEEDQQVVLHLVASLSKKSRTS